MSVTVQASKHPLKPEWVYADVEANQSVYEICGGAPVVAFINGKEVPAELHKLTRVKDGANLVVWPVPQDVSLPSPSDLLSSIAGIAVAAAAVATVGLLTPTIGLFAASAAGVGVSILGNMAVNSLIPPQQPEIPEPGESFNRLQSITGTSNRVAAFQPIPRLYGTHQMFPPIPMTARPFTEVQGGNQYLRMMFCLGYGPLEIGGATVGKGRSKITQGTSLSDSPVRIGQTDINLLEEVEFEIGRPDQMTLYSDQVIEVDPAFTTRNLSFDDGSSGTRSDGQFAIRTTEPDADEISLDFQGQLFSVNDEAKTRRARVRFRIEYREVGASSWIVFDDNFVISSRKKETVRVGTRFRVSRGQYEVRVTRVSTTHDAATAFANELSWSALRTIRSRTPFLVDDTVCMSLRIKATDQLNGRIDNLTVLATSVLEVYNGNSWSEQPTNNPAWAYADVWSGVANRQPVGKEDLDADRLLEWAQYCDEEGLEFNAVFDSKSTTLERAREVAGAGLAAWRLTPESKISVVRDVVQSLPRMIISPRNSFGFNYELSTVQTPDALRVQFTDDRTWENTERIVYDDGFGPGNAELFETIQGKGITNADQAWKYGRFHLAQQRLRPERYNFQQDVQHLRYDRGDLLTIQNDVILVGIGAGRIKDVVSDSEIVLDEEFIDQGKDYAVKIQHSDGSISTVGATLGAGPTNQTVFLDSAVSKAQKDDLVIFGEAGKESFDVKVTEIQPQGDLQVSVSCVPAAPEMENVWDEQIPPFEPVLTEPTSPDLVLPKIPEITDIRSDETVLLPDSDGSLRIRMVVSTRLAAFPGWDQRNQIRFRPVGDNNFVITDPFESSNFSIFDVSEEVEYEVQVRGVRNGLFSPWSRATVHTVIGKSNPPPDVPFFSATQNGVNVDFNWNPAVARDLEGYEIRVGQEGDTFSSASKLLSTSELSTEASTQLPAGEYKFFIKARDTSGNLSESSADQVLKVLPPPKVQDFTAEQDGIRVNFNWRRASYFGLDGYEIKIGKVSDTFETANLLIDVGAPASSAFDLVEPGNYRFFIKSQSILNDQAKEASFFDLSVEEPPEVENFSTTQNGETVVFRWEPVDYFGLKGYEIRYGDPDSVTWPSGSKIVEANQSTAIAQADVPPGTYKFMIKALSDLDSESSEPNERVFTVKTDYFERTRVEHHPDWESGWYRGFILQGNSLIVKSDFEAFYVSDEIDLLFDAEDIRAWAVLQAAFSDAESVKDNRRIVDGIRLFQDNSTVEASVTDQTDNGELDIGLPLSDPLVFQEIATRDTGDLWQDSDRTIERYGSIVSDTTQTQSYGEVAETTQEFDSYDTLMGWRSWTKGEVDARFVKYRARIKQRPSETSSKILRKFTTVVDIEERIERQQEKTVEVGGTTFTFDKSFHFVPSVVSAVESDDDLFPIRKNVTRSEVTFVVKDLQGNDVGTDNLDFIATGA